jgi:hypothetical protein
VLWQRAIHQARLELAGSDLLVRPQFGALVSLAWSDGSTQWRRGHDPDVVLEGLAGGAGLALATDAGLMVLTRAAARPPPFHATITGTLRVDGRGVAGATIHVYDATATTDTAGRFSSAVEIPGVAVVAPDWSTVRAPRLRPCLFGRPARVDIEDRDHGYEVAIDVEARPYACAHSCDGMIDCE